MAVAAAANPRKIFLDFPPDFTDKHSLPGD